MNLFFHIFLLIQLFYFQYLFFLLNLYILNIILILSLSHNDIIFIRISSHSQSFLYNSIQLDNNKLFCSTPSNSLTEIY